MMSNLGQIMPSGTFPTQGDSVSTTFLSVCQPVSDYHAYELEINPLKPGEMTTADTWTFARYKQLYPSAQPMMQCSSPAGSTVYREMTSAEKAQYMAGDRVRDLTAGAGGRGQGQGLDIMAWIKENPLLVVAILAGLGYLYYMSKKEG